MAKASKVGKRKLKRQVRKTIGALFLASALVVASIPVESLRAESIPQADHITVTDADNNIPTITANDTIYATGDGTYRFAYVRAEGSSDKVAVILQYRGGNLRDNSLVIPNVFEHVYKKYIDNDGTDQGYVAVGESGNSLYYKVQEQIAPPQDILDENGIVIGQTPPFLVDRYYPCYYENITAWNHVAATDFYYIKSNDYEDEIPSVSAGDASQFTKVDGDTSVMPISDIRVAYIGNQYLNDEGTEVAGDVTEGSRGVFAQNGNIVDLTIGDDMLGIGDYAFFRCSSLGNGDSKITLGNGLNTIGNSAFEGCINMEGIVLDKTSNLNKIGSKAFKDCQGLLEFQVPIAVQEIGDSAFEGCTAMETIILDGNYPSGKDNVALRDLGVSVFKNCSSLQYVSLPSTYTTAEDISFVQGCTSLRYIRLPNQLTELKKDYDVIDWEQFRSTVPKEFYLSGKDVSETHTLAGAEAFAFRYIDNNGNDQDIYEIIIRDGDGDDDDNKALYQVNSNNQLIGAEIGEKIKTVEIPPTIGPYQITQIDGSSFQGNCYIQELIIPPSITSIAAGAFKGCHNLYSVIFTEPVNVASIGAEAFKTQDVVIHRAGCSEQLMDPPVLTFTGPISDSGSSSAPYEYAMNASNYFNNGDQARTYITYYSGWPSNLEVRYNPETDTNELINYPTVAQVKSGQYASSVTIDGKQMPQYPYLTEADKIALTDIQTNYPGALTDDGQELLDHILTLDIPKGVESFESGLFYSNENAEVNTGHSILKTIVTNGLAQIPANSFEGCETLSAIQILGDTTAIGANAFLDCVNLESAVISPTVSSLGSLPFAGCDKLSNVSFGGGPYYVYDNWIIYGLQDGQKQSVVECLEGRGTPLGGSPTVQATELAGVTTIEPKAFQNCEGLGAIQLNQSSIFAIPDSAFEATTELFSVILPTTCGTIGKNAFKDSAVRQVEIPNSVGSIEPSAFNTGVGAREITFYTPEDSYAYRWAQQYPNILTETVHEPTYVDIYFWADPDGSGGNEPLLLKTQTVEVGLDATPPDDRDVPQREGYTFTGWAPDYHAVSRTLDVMAQYDANDPDADKFTVRFIDWDDTVLKTMLVAPGQDAEAPILPTREGYTCTGWRPELTNITANTDIYAQYEIDNALLRVNYYDYDGTTLLYTDTVAYGENAVSPKDPVREGYTFTGWLPVITNITTDLNTFAQYERIDSTETQYTVQFIDYDDTVLYVQKVDEGENAIEPRSPRRSGYVFTGWRPAVTAVTKDTDTYAQYEIDKNGDGYGDDTGAGDGIPGNSGGNGNGGDDGNGNGNGNGGNTGQAAVYYTLTVQNGSGSGSYVAGASVIVIASDPAKGQDFSHWTIDPTGTFIASKNVTATVITMPASAVTVTAHYESDGTGSANTSTGSGNTSTGNGSGNSSGNGSTGNITGGSGGNTTVIISKNGLSNTGVVTAKINGSSDDFVIRISEDTTATEEVIRALMAKYGSLENIAYFPMDITLYDSTGEKEITDTSGLSIDITLPLPDSLIRYGGNNEVAAVKEGKLEDLSPKFSTISRVACVTFRAEHFSPYVIYVDTTNLSSGTQTDQTPKTGDGIHPKWFLSFGLAFVSILFFAKRDKAPKRKLA